MDCFQILNTRQRPAVDEPILDQLGTTIVHETLRVGDVIVKY